MDNIKELLLTIKSKIEFYNKLAEENGENFNIFSILNMEDKEVETHSKFIYELLNPEGSHHQGDKFLRLFLFDVLGLDDELDNNLEGVKVLREDLIEDSKRIDFTITTKEIIIGIEMKIYAEDQDKQLIDYKNELKKRNSNNCLYYLTLFGSEASENSAGYLKPTNLKTERGDNHYIILSFKEDILNWLDLSIKSVAMKPVLREAIYQYKILIEKLTCKRVELTMEIKEFILNNDYLETSFEILKAFEEVKIEVQKQFWIKLKEELNGKLKDEYKFDFWKTDKNNNIYKNDNIDELVKDYYFKKGQDGYGLIAKIIDLNENNNESILFCILIGYNIFYGYTLKINNILKNETIPNNLPKDLSDFIAKFTNDDDKLFGYKFLKPKKYNKYNFHNFSEKTIAIYKHIDDNIKESVQQILNDMPEYCKKKQDSTNSSNETSKNCDSDK